MSCFTLVTAAALALFPPPRPATSTATVALVTDLPAAGARAAVIRRVAPRADIILLARASASSDDLAAALALLAAARTRDGPNPPARDEVLIVKSSSLQQPLETPRRLRLDAHLARLRAAPARQVDGVGTVPAIEVSVRARPGPR